MMRVSDSSRAVSDRGETGRASGDVGSGLALVGAAPASSAWLYTTRSGPPKHALRAKDRVKTSGGASRGHSSMAPINAAELVRILVRG